MFAKKNRFSFKNRLPRQSSNFPSFSVRYDKNDEGLKVAVVVSKKVDKRAVVRNRIKRVILEAIRKEIETSTPMSLIFYAKKQAAESSNLAEEVKKALDTVPGLTREPE
jgi:ribonuclease P protein component